VTVPDKQLADVIEQEGFSHWSAAKMNCHNLWINPHGRGATTNNENMIPFIWQIL
jgi:hypothetical protein